MTDSTTDPNTSATRQAGHTPPADLTRDEAGPGALGAESAPVTLAEHAHTVAEQLRATFVPPEVWSSGRPPLRVAWEFARHGPHLPDDPRPRVTARVIVGVLLPLRAVLHVLDWVLEAGSRVAVALVLAFCLLQAFDLI